MNNLEKIILVSILLITTTFYGQHRPDREKIRTLKVAFITERLDLSSSEAEAFWPAYNAHQKQMNSFRRTERTEIREKLRNIHDVSNQEAEKLLDKFIRIEEEKQNERKSFLAEIKKSIGAKKTILLIKAEEGFKRQLIKQYRNKRGEGRFR